MDKPWECKYCHVTMELIDQDHCICPQCGVSVWEPIEKMGEMQEIMENGEKGKISAYDPAMGGRRSSGCGKSRKHGRNMRKLSQQELYNNLTKG